MKIEIEIEKVTVIQGSGPDKVLLQTNFPDSFINGANKIDTFLCLQFDATYNTGEQYCKDNFNMIPEVIYRSKRGFFAETKGD